MGLTLCGALALGAGCSKNSPPAESANGDSPPADPAGTPAPAEAVAATPTCADPDPAALAATKAKLEAALAGDHRSEDNRGRDAWRHPVQTLQFFGLTSDMTVLELWPGGGWYTEVLAPAIDGGKLLVTNFDPEGDKRMADYGKRLTEKLAGNELYADVTQIYVAPPDKISFGEDNQLDMALTFRNNHNWIGAGYEDTIYAAAFKALKPCGIFGVVQHRAKEGATEEEWKGKGYVPQDYLIEKIQAAGFELVDKSEVNANPKDTKDHPNGVWTLPPRLAVGEGDKEPTEEQKAPYLAIGESDRMTLKFRKPGNQ